MVCAPTSVQFSEVCRPERSLRVQLPIVAKPWLASTLHSIPIPNNITLSVSPVPPHHDVALRSNVLLQRSENPTEYFFLGDDLYSFLVSAPISPIHLYLLFHSLSGPRAWLT